MRSAIHKRLGLLYKLSDKDRLAICQEIAEACEKSFRRGFQQGYMGAGEVVVDVERWRFATSLAKSPSAHGTYSTTALYRHGYEVGLPYRISEPESCRTS